MTVQLDHTIVHAHGRHETARHLAELLGLHEPTRQDPLLVVTRAYGVRLGVADELGPPHPQHYAFGVSDDDFDAVHARIRDRGRDWWADPLHRRPHEIGSVDGGRSL